MVFLNLKLAHSDSCVYLCWLWVYGHYKYFKSLGAETVFIRQNMTSTCVRF